MTINSWATQHWAIKSKLKNQYKETLKNWFLDNEKLPEELHFEWFPVYKDKRKRDSINIAPTIKIFEDCLTELGCIDDDDKTSHHIHRRKVDSTLSMHQLKVIIYERKDDD